MQDLYSGEHINFKKVHWDDAQKRVLIVFPGILGNTDYAFKLQIPIFAKFGNVVLVYYAHGEFSAKGMSERFTEFLESEPLKNKSFVFIGLSFGSSFILRYLSSGKPSILKKVEKIMLFGTVVSANDFRSKMIWKFVGLFSWITLEKKLDFATKIMKFVLDGDHYWTDRADIKQAIRNVKNSTIANRLNFLFDEFDKASIKAPRHINALFVWWRRDFVSTKRRHEIEQIFTHRVSLTIRGRHGWMASAAKKINPAIEEFLCQRTKISCQND